MCDRRDHGSADEFIKFVVSGFARNEEVYDIFPRTEEQQNILQIAKDAGTKVPETRPRPLIGACLIRSHDYDIFLIYMFITRAASEDRDDSAPTW